MPQAETFVVRVKTPQGGVMLGDVTLRKSDGSIAPIILNTGYALDLENIDLVAFARSSRNGELAAMEERGSLARILVEVTEKTSDTLQAELFKNPKRGKDGPYAHATQVISIEPGLMVSVGGDRRRVAPPEAIVAGAQTEPATIPAPDTKNFQDPAILAGPQEHAPAGKAGPLEPPIEEEVSDWKDGKTLNDQEEFIKSSKDLAFLKKVAADKKETKKMQRLAKARLAELE